MNRTSIALAALAVLACALLGNEPTGAQETPGGISGIALPPPPPPPPPPVLPPPPPPNFGGVFNPSSVIPQSFINPMSNPLDQNSSLKNAIQGAASGVSSTTSGLGVNTGQPSIKNSSLLGGSNAAGASIVNLMTVDLETAMLAIQTQRTQNIETQLKTQMNDIQARNDQIKKLNEQISEINKKVVAALFKGDVGTAQKLSTVINALKLQIDSLNSMQQLDMLRMQSMVNKRNEAFDIMSNFIKKMADSRSSILGNMR